MRVWCQDGRGGGPSVEVRGKEGGIPARSVSWHETFGGAGRGSRMRKTVVARRLIWPASSFWRLREAMRGFSRGEN